MDGHYRGADLAGQLSEYWVRIVGPCARPWRDALDLAVQRRGVDPKPRVDVVDDVPRIGVPGEFLTPARRWGARDKIADISQCQPVETKRNIAAREMLDDVVETFSGFGVVAGLTHRCEPLGVDQRVEFRTRRIEERQAGEIRGGGGVGVEPVDLADTVDDAAFDQGTLVGLRVQFKRRDRDMPAHRLPVNDGPARLPETLGEMRF